jgi:glutathione S-transferase
MLKLWGRANSVNVQKAMLCLEELGLAHERVDAGMAHGIVDSPAYRAMNPNGVIPTLADGDFILWESNVIVRYLSSKFGDDAFYPVDLQKRADADRWMDWQQTTLNLPVTICFWGLVRAPGAKSPAEIEDATRNGIAHVATLDALLSTRPFVTGDAFGMADCVLAPTVHRWLHLPIQHPPTPHLDRYYADVMKRPAARHVMSLPLT